MSPHGKAAQESARRKQKFLCDSQSFPACSLQEATRMLSSARPQASPPTSHTHTPRLPSRRHLNTSLSGCTWGRSKQSSCDPTLPTLCHKATRDAWPQLDLKPRVPTWVLQGHFWTSNHQSELKWKTPGDRPQQADRRQTDLSGLTGDRQTTAADSRTQTSAG